MFTITQMVTDYKFKSKAVSLRFIADFLVGISICDFSSVAHHVFQVLGKKVDIKMEENILELKQKTDPK